MLIINKVLLLLFWHVLCCSLDRHSVSCFCVSGIFVFLHSIDQDSSSPEISTFILQSMLPFILAISRCIESSWRKSKRLLDFFFFFFINVMTDVAVLLQIDTVVCLSFCLTLYLWFCKCFWFLNCLCHSFEFFYFLFLVYFSYSLFAVLLLFCCCRWFLCFAFLKRIMGHILRFNSCLACFVVSKPNWVLWLCA